MDKIEEVLTRRVNNILPTKGGLEKLLRSGKKLKLYLGLDPTATRLHMGHTIGLRKLMEFANLGHEVTLLFGTGTVLVGDPSKRDSARKLITSEEIKENIKTWKKQVAPIVDFKKITIKKNGDWLTKLTVHDIIKIASNISAVQLFKRKSFQQRIDKGDTVWYHETMYPLFQGYDSVVMNVDLEIGGTDQEFNMLVGRELQKKMAKREKYVMTWPMILGTDGKQMSKSSGNCIWLSDTSDDMFGKTMSVPDSQIKLYMEMLTDIPSEEIESLKKEPLKNKKRLAYEITKQFHGQNKALDAQKQFEKTYGQKSPDYKKETPKRATLSETVSTALGTSLSQSKRLIREGAIDVNQVTVNNPKHNINGGEKIKIGKKTFVKVSAK